MKNISNFILAFFALASIYSCTKDIEERPIIQAIAGPVLQAPANGNNYVLLPENAASLAERFVWRAADFGNNVEVTYTVEMDLANGDFSNPRVLGSDFGTNLPVTVETMNASALGLGIAPFEAGNVKARVVARVGSFTPMMSNEITFSVTPYTTERPKIWVPGGYQGSSGYKNDWSPADAPALSATGFGETNFEGYVYFSGANEFKFTSHPNWDNTNWGADGPGKLSPTGGNLSISEAGYYRFQVDTEALTWSSLKTSWGLIGSATPNGWDGDQDMTYDLNAKVWSITLNLNAGEIKFRSNDDWSLNFGNDDDGDGSLNEGGTNIAVSEPGNYTVRLNLSNPRAYSFELIKN